MSHYIHPVDGALVGTGSPRLKECAGYGVTRYFGCYYLVPTPQEGHGMTPRFALAFFVFSSSFLCLVKHLHMANHMPMSFRI